MNDFSDDVCIEETSSLGEYANRGSWVVTKVPSCGMPEVSMVTFSVLILNAFSFSDMVFSMGGRALTMHINGIYVAESVLEGNEGLAGLMVERDIKLP